VLTKRQRRHIASGNVADVCPLRRRNFWRFDATFSSGFVKEMKGESRGGADRREEAPGRRSWRRRRCDEPGENVVNQEQV
jgi:hypothetical protein